MIDNQSTLETSESDWVMVVCDYPEAKPTTGGEQRSLKIVEELASYRKVIVFNIGYKNIQSTARVVVINRTNIENNNTKIKRIVNRIKHNLALKPPIYHSDAALCDNISKIIKDYGIKNFVIRYFRNYMKIEKALPKEGKIFVDFDDVDHHAVKRRLFIEKNILKKLLLRYHYYRALWHIKRNSEKINFYLVSNELDLIDCFPKNVCIYLPNVPFFKNLHNSSKFSCDKLLLNTAYGTSILAVGSWDHPPNKNGLTWFITNVLPEVVKFIPAVKLLVVGRGASWIGSYMTPHIQYLGFLDDLADVYSFSDIVVCPIHYGGGTNIKLIEALSLGKTIVTTTFGARGLNLERHPLLRKLIVDDAHQQAQMIVRLLMSTKLREKFGNASRSWFDNFDPERLFKERLCFLNDNLS